MSGKYECHISPDDIKSLAIEKGLEEIRKLCPDREVKFVGFHWEGTTLVVYGDAVGVSDANS
jgi:hypothetical protein